MTDVTAIDILVEPDGLALARAAAENERMRAQYPAGFSLDDRHMPHTTLLQRCARTAELESAFAAVTKLVEARDLLKPGFRATGIRPMPRAALSGVGLAAIVATLYDVTVSLVSNAGPRTAAQGPKPSSLVDCPGGKASFGKDAPFRAQSRPVSPSASEARAGSHVTGLASTR